MADVALIPPFSMLSWIRNRKLQMALPYGLNNRQYRDAYLYEGLVPNTYTILDNGMFEGAQEPFLDLLTVAEERSWDEVVLPDVRGDASSTGKLVESTLTDLKDHEDTPNVNFMAVIQGKDVAEQMRLAYVYAGILPPGTVIGIPRKLADDPQDPFARTNIVNRMVNEFEDYFHYHFLGLSRTNPSDIRAVVLQFGDLVRGTDTDAPWVWAANNMPLMHGAQNLNFSTERPKHYFAMSEEHFDKGVLSHNIATLDAWARGDKA